MKNRYLSILLISLGIILFLTACGEKSQEDVVKKLSETMENLNGYKAEAKMTMNTGQEQQSFNIDIWHQKGDFYRVKLGHEEGTAGSQVILKNEDGVFVLTPELEKSFRFQSEWPDNSSQPYLYQSLVKDVIQDEEAEFEAAEEHFIFKTKTNYQSNSNLPYQEIYFDKKNYTPTSVKVMDRDNQALVEVQFTSFDTAATFETDDFALDKNMEKDAAAMAEDEGEGVLTVLEPLYTAGAVAIEKKEVDLENGKRVILTYGGEKSFTFIQEKRDDVEAAAPREAEGDIVNLGTAVGALSDGKLEWSLSGVDYTIASDTLTKQEMIDIAQSVQGQQIK